MLIIVFQVFQRIFNTLSQNGCFGLLSRTSKVTKWVCERFAQNVAEHKFVQPKFEGEKLSEKFSAEMEFCKIGSLC
jgi:hypothetical protein